MAEIVVDVSARLKVMQSSVEEMRKVLNKLEPNSTGFKNLQKVIETITSDIDKLRTQTSKPFLSQNQFNATKKTADKLEEDLEKVRITMERIKFSDLKLDASQTAQLDTFKNQIDDLQKKFTDFKNNLKTQLLSNNIADSFIKSINPELVNKSFDEIVKNIQRKTDKLGEDLAKVTKELEEAQQIKNVGEQVEKIPKEGFLSEKMLGDNFKKFFANGNKGVKFKSIAGKSGEIQKEFFEYLKKEFLLSPDQINQLQQKSASSIQKILSNSDFFNPQKTSGQKASAQLQNAGPGSLGARFQSASQEYERAAGVIANTLQPLLQALAAEEQNVTDETENINQSTRNLEQSWIQETRNGQEVKNTLSNLGQQAESFKGELEQLNSQWIALQKTQNTFNSIKSAIVNFMGFNQVLNITKRAVQEAANHIKQLDTVMNGIAIVTDMSTKDLWNQIDAYSEMAQRYGTTIQGVYEVSKIYYQAGYETNEVLTLMNETLKLSKISGLDYATTTDYMMTATRGFHMEISEAAKVVDVYSALAANTAVSQQELAEAMTRTASSMESVGATFEETSAMIATIVAVTRETANNIGSAMKSIASRYGELTKDPTKLLDSEGEAMSFNRVDEALKSVGISLQTTDHQFRNFTEVITELADKWDTLDSAQQRYIATQFAGNRQQSRFLALVSNKDLLKENMAVAEASEDTGTLQAIKALDSLETKLNQVQVAYQQFYTTVGVEGVWKFFLDATKNVIDTLNRLPKLFGKIPINAIAMIGNLVKLVKNLLFKGLTTIASVWTKTLNQTLSNPQPTQEANKLGQKISEFISKGFKEKQGELENTINQGVNQAINKTSTNLQNNDQINSSPLQIASQQAIETIDLKTLTNSPFNKEDLKDLFTFSPNILNGSTDAMKDAFIGTLVEMENAGVVFSDEMLDTLFSIGDGIGKNIQPAIKNTTGLIGKVTESTDKWLTGISKKGSPAAKAFDAIGMTLTTIGGLINTNNKAGQISSGIITGIGGGFQTATAAARVMVGDLSALPSLLMGVLNIVNGISILWETDEERLERLSKIAEDLSNKAKEEKANYNTLNRSIDKLNELEEKRYESAEAAEEYQTAVDELADKFPEMIAGFDAAGNIILDTTDAERLLAEAREKSKKATYNAAKAEMDAAEDKLNSSKNKIEKNPFNAPEISTDVGTYDGFIKEISESENSSDIEKDFLEKISSNVSVENNGLYFSDDVENALKSLEGKYSEDEIATLKNNIDAYIKGQDSLFLDLNKLGELSNELNNLDLTSSEGIEKYKELSLAVIKFREQYQKILEEDDGSLSDVIENFENLESWISNIGNSLSEYITLNDIYKGHQRGVLSAWQDANTNNGKAWEYFEESANLAAILTKQMQQEVGEANYDDVKDDLAPQWQEYQIAMEEFYSNLSEANQKLLNQMLSDNGANYTGKDIVDKFNIENTTEENDLYDMFINYYSEGIKSIYERLKNNLTKKYGEDYLNNADSFISKYDETIENTREDLTKNEGTFLNSILAQYESLSEKGFSDRAVKVGIAGLDLFNAIQDLDSDIQASIINSVLENGFATKEGIQKTLDAYKDNQQVTNAIKDPLTNIMDLIITNVPLAIQTATSELLNEWEDTSKKLNKALSGGLEIKEADALITKAEGLGLSLDLNKDFTRNGDKLVLTAKAFNDYWEALNRYNIVRVDELQRNIDDANKILNVSQRRLESNRNLGLFITESMKATIEAINPNFDFDKYLTNGRLNIAGIKALQEAIKNSSENLDYYNNLAQIAADSLKEFSDWAQGDYSSTELDINGLKELASGKMDLKRDDFTLRSARENINSAYNSLISDVLSKGFENINLEDYNGLIKEDLENIENVINKGSYKDFIIEYAKLAGKSLEEINALTIQAIEKENQSTIGANDVLKNITMLSSKRGYGSLKDIQSLADALGMQIEEILGEYNSQLDAWEVNIDFTTIEGSLEKLEDSFNGFIDSIAENISKAISGKSTKQNVNELIGQLKELGINSLSEYDFTKTAEGLQLSQQAAFNLYQNLLKVDALRAKLIFDDLVKSLEESNENYLNISTITARVYELQRKIATLKPGDARRKEYEDELTVAKEIMRIRAATDDKSYNFMDRSLSEGMQNPIDYWNAAGKAYTAMNKAAKSGYMDVEDFVNIVQEMNNMALTSGESIEFMGYTLSGDIASANKMISDAMEALTNVDGKGVKIAFKKLGDSFKTGIGAMTGNFDSGLKEMAKAQIKLLDSMIAMLEAVVAIQDINLDNNNDGLISFEELFINEDGLEKANKILQELALGFGEFKVGDQSLVEALVEYLNPDELLKFFNSLTDILNSDIDPAEIRNKIQELITATFSDKESNIKEGKQAGKVSIEGIGLLPDLGLTQENLGEDLYKNLKEALINNGTLKPEEKDKLIQVVREYNEEYANTLEKFLFDENHEEKELTVPLADLFKVSTFITSSEEDDQQAWTLPDGSTYKSFDAAFEALNTYITSEDYQKYTGNDTLNVGIEEELDLNGEILCNLTFTVNNNKVTYEDANHKYNDIQEVVDETSKELEEERENGIKIPELKELTVITSQGVSYVVQTYSDGTIRYGKLNGMTDSSGSSIDFITKEQFIEELKQNAIDNGNIELDPVTGKPIDVPISSGATFIVTIDEKGERRYKIKGKQGESFSEEQIKDFLQKSANNQDFTSLNTEVTNTNETILVNKNIDGINFITTVDYKNGIYTIDDGNGYRVNGNNLEGVVKSYYQYLKYTANQNLQNSLNSDKLDSENSSTIQGFQIPFVINGIQYSVSLTGKKSLNGEEISDFSKQVTDLLGLTSSIPSSYNDTSEHSLTYQFKYKDIIYGVEIDPDGTKKYYKFSKNGEKIELTDDEINADGDLKSALDMQVPETCEDDTLYTMTYQVQYDGIKYDVTVTNNGATVTQDGQSVDNNADIIKQLKTKLNLNIPTEHTEKLAGFTFIYDCEGVRYAVQYDKNGKPVYGHMEGDNFVKDDDVNNFPDEVKKVFGIKKEDLTSGEENLSNYTLHIKYGTFEADIEYNKGKWMINGEEIPGADNLLSALAMWAERQNEDNGNDDENTIEFTGQVKDIEISKIPPNDLTVPVTGEMQEVTSRGNDPKEEEKPPKQSTYVPNPFEQRKNSFIFDYNNNTDKQNVLNTWGSRYGQDLINLINEEGLFSSYSETELTPDIIKKFMTQINNGGFGSVSDFSRIFSENNEKNATEKAQIADFIYKALQGDGLTYFQLESSDNGRSHGGKSRDFDKTFTVPLTSTEPIENTEQIEESIISTYEDAVKKIDWNKINLASTWFSQFNPEGTSSDLMKNFINALKDNELTEEEWNNIINTQSASDEEWKNLGKFIVKGLATGITDNQSESETAIDTLGELTIEKAKELFGIASPSKVMHDIGENVSLGLANGIESEANSVILAVNTLISAITLIAASAAGTGNNLLSANLSLLALSIGQLYENANKLANDVAWDVIFEKLELLNTNTPNEDSFINKASDIIRQINAIVTLEYDNEYSKELLNNKELNRTINLLIKEGTNLEEPQDKTVTITENSITSVNTDTSGFQTSLSDANNALQSSAKSSDDFTEKIDNLGNSFDNVNSTIEEINKLSEVMENAATASKTLTTIMSTVKNIPDVAWRISRLNSALNGIPATKSANLTLKYKTEALAKGNANTRNSGTAMAKGKKTLMGELGPELVVSNGHYFIVGENGAEFVDLAKDAIVFNHKQTRHLLSKGMISSRGEPFTTENNAISFARGNIPTQGIAKAAEFVDADIFSELLKELTVIPSLSNIKLFSYAKGNTSGPAMAGAQAALAQLKAIRAMWQRMLDASARDLGSQAGRGSGGGGGGNNDPLKEKSVTADIERWYNLLRQIDKLEKDITYQESLQNKILSDRIINGKALYNSYKQELDFLDQEIVRNKELAALQKSWYDVKRQQLAESWYGKIFQYDENGLQQYVGSGAPGSGLGLDILETLNRRDKNNKPIMTALQQLQYLSGLGLNIGELLYADDGTQVATISGTGNGLRVYSTEKGDNQSQLNADAAVAIMENFWDNLDGWRDELDGIYDSYHEQLNTVLENESKRNDILQKIIDNQLSVEQDVLKAIESREQALIDELQDQRDALEDSTNQFLDGLNDSLTKEREMYDKNQNDQELTKLQRQLAILQRSGGSASQIRSLQDQINSKQQDAYFDAQQKQIDTIQEASDKEIERLDAQIDLMTETLEYQKEHGLLWEEVYYIMSKTPEEIKQFITENTPDFESNSALQVTEDIRDLKSRIEQWTNYRDDNNNPISNEYEHDWNTYKNSVANTPLASYLEANEESMRQRFAAEMSASGDENKAAESINSLLRAQYISDLEEKRAKEAAEQQEAANATIGMVSNLSGIIKKGSRGDAVKKLQTALNALGYGNSGTQSVDGIFGDGTEKAVKAFQRAMGIAVDGQVGPDTKGKFRLMGYKKGGEINFTGPAFVHGTPARPEYILNADQTKMLKDNLLSSRIDNFGSVLSYFNGIANSAASISNTNNMSDGSIQIDNIELNMNVNSINNDYDARQAGSAALDEIVKIARKSGTRGIIRR